MPKRLTKDQKRAIKKLRKLMEQYDKALAIARRIKNARRREKRKHRK